MLCRAWSSSVPQYFLLPLCVHTIVRSGSGVSGTTILYLDACLTRRSDDSILYVLFFHRQPALPAVALSTCSSCPQSPWALSPPRLTRPSPSARCIGYQCASFWNILPPLPPYSSSCPGTQSRARSCILVPPRTSSETVPGSRSLTGPPAPPVF